MSREESLKTLKKIKDSMDAGEITREDVINDLGILKPGQIDPDTEKVMSTSGKLVDPSAVLASVGIPSKLIPERWLNV